MCLLASRELVRPELLDHGVDNGGLVDLLCIPTRSEFCECPVLPVGGLRVGETSIVTISVGGFDGFVDGWVDFNLDGETE